MIHLYTHNDLDGLGCGILAKMAFGEEVEVHYNSVARLNSQVERYFEITKKNQQKEDLLLITDLTVNEANSKRIDQFVKEGGKAKFIDHHKTALHLNEFDWATVVVSYDDGKLTSATSLFYDYLMTTQNTWEWEKNNLL